MTYAFHCTACGRCCNSPPRLSLAELFRFQDVFIGCLAVTRLADRGDAERAALFDTLGYRAAAPGGATHIAILPQGYGYDGLARCPALTGDGKCSLHARGKPAQCATVPLDALAPDSRQNLVLAERLQDTVWREAGCIAADADGAHVPLVEAARVADPEFASALGERRGAMAADRRIWGRAVFDMVRSDWAPMEAALSRVLPGGFVALPMVPAVLVVAGFSAAYRRRCVAFLQAQVALIETNVQQAVQRRREAERPMTQRLRAWADAYRALTTTLVAGAVPQAALAADFQAEIEAWLGATLKAA